MKPNKMLSRSSRILFSLLAMALVLVLAAPTQTARCAACGPVYGEWKAMSPSILEPRSASTAVWTGKEVIFWRGNGNSLSFAEGALYNPRTDSWRPMKPSPLYPRVNYFSVWTGKELIIWGGTGPDLNGQPVGWLGDGARYDPRLDQWTMLSSANAPSPRGEGAVVWTGDEMIIWGGTATGGNRGDGGIYNLERDEWTLIPALLQNSPSPRLYPSAAWLGEKMFLWGGFAYGKGYYQDGGLYDPILNQWQPISTLNAPAPRSQAGAYLFTSSQRPEGEVLVFGGGGTDPAVKYGSIYTPKTDTWRALSPMCIDSGFGSIAWTGTELYTWRDGLFEDSPAAGVRYNPILDAWFPLPTGDAPGRRLYASSVWTGREFILWGGERDWGMTYVNDGGRLLVYPYQLALPAVSIMSGAPGLVSPDPLVGPTSQE